MTDLAGPDRAEVLEMLAAFGQRAVESVPEELGSLELTWLIAEFEQRYGIEPDLDDERFEAVRTVDDAVEVFRAAVLAAAGGAADAGATTTVGALRT
ncbi:acyl carrier protein [Streptomyces sp. BE20]|uniref:acyl carrier protein n=1 Tax=Streptomycetaceae TaxID=2062 RepID=UPI002E75A3A6|nr:MULTISPECIES: acyl carrier protein [unclassified Streptomyces]MED7953837.1 acyl carrier protein [Streptomyces sp. BE303]MEE1825059.1 acyl carrier protein [Streptomyces sp. BE20]